MGVKALDIKVFIKRLIILDSHLLDNVAKEPSEASGTHAKRIVFGSGDDLEDDFFGNEEDEGTKPPKLSKTKQNQSDHLLKKPTIKKMKSSPKMPSPHVNKSLQTQLLVPNNALHHLLSKTFIEF